MILQATQQLLDELPSYAELTTAAALSHHTRHNEPQGNQAAVWICDSILATRVQFLMSVLGPCLPALPQVRSLFCPARWRWPQLQCSLLYAVLIKKHWSVIGGEEEKDAVKNSLWKFFTASFPSSPAITDQCFLIKTLYSAVDSSYVMMEG